MENTHFKTMTSKDQRKITLDWLKLVPSMKMIAKKPMGLHKRIGPLVISLWLKKPPNACSYEPRLCCHNLCVPSPSVVTSRYAGCFAETFNIDSMGNSIDGEPTGIITLATHEKIYRHSFDILRKRTTFQLKNSVTLVEVVEEYHRYILQQTSVMSEIYDQALIAAWSGNKKLVSKCMDWAKNNQDKVLAWNMGGYCEDQNWLVDLEKRISNPKLLRETVEKEVILHKLNDVSYQDLL